jgi:hypothetical protein
MPENIKFNIPNNRQGSSAHLDVLVFLFSLNGENNSYQQLLTRAIDFPIGANNGITNK